MAGYQYLRLWKRFKDRRLRRIPLPIFIAVTLIQERYDLKTFEDAIYLIVKRDPEAKEIIRYVLTGKGKVRLKGEPTLAQELEEDE